jgi:phosphohistidine phosphatase SixA
MTTELCLVRHGIAGTPGPRWPDDRKRPLTPGGRAKMETAAPGLWALFEPDVIFTSPLTRAVQTAEVIASLRPAMRPIETDLLASHDFGGFLRLVASNGAGRLMGVGHVPSINMLASFALTGDPESVWFEVKKGSAILLSFAGEVRAGGAVLSWALPPRALRAIAQSGRLADDPDAEG